jgi:hypothetical protein
MASVDYVKLVADALKVPLEEAIIAVSAKKTKLDEAQKVYDAAKQDHDAAEKNLQHLQNIINGVPNMMPQQTACSSASSSSAESVAEPVAEQAYARVASRRPFAPVATPANPAKPHKRVSANAVIELFEKVHQLNPCKFCFNESADCDHQSDKHGHLPANTVLFPLVGMRKINPENNKDFAEVSKDALYDIQQWSSDRSNSDRLVDVQRLFLVYRMNFKARNLEDFVVKVREMMDAMNAYYTNQQYNDAGEGDYSE